jgi:hypothetical protein
MSSSVIVIGAVQVSDHPYHIHINCKNIVAVLQVKLRCFDGGLVKRE